MTRGAVTVAALMIVSLAVVACGGGTDAPGDDSGVPSAVGADVVTAADGGATLAVPSGALPAGVQPEDLGVRVVSDSVAREDARVVVTYELKPDGLQLLSPATLTVEFAVPDPSGQLLVIHAFGDDSELINDVELEFGLETNTLSASIQLTHFSAVIYTYVPNPFQAFMEVSALEVPFGETFDVTVRVIRVSDPIDVIEFYEGANADAYIHLADAPWRLSGSLSGEGSVTPREFDEAPPLTTVTGSGFTIAETFECGSSGGGRVSFAGSIQYQQSVVWSVPGYGVTNTALEDKTADISASSDDIECVMPRVVASAAPPLTTYTLSPEIPSATFFAWVGANCGSVTGSAASTMVWSHGEGGCEHAGEAHPDAEISVLVAGTLPASGKPFELFCRYLSAASGEGLECTLEK